MFAWISLAGSKLAPGEARWITNCGAPGPGLVPAKNSENWWRMAAGDDIICRISFVFCCVEEAMRFRSIVVVALLTLLVQLHATAQAPRERVDTEVVNKIKEEGQ